MCGWACRWCPCKRWVISRSRSRSCSSTPSTYHPSSSSPSLRRSTRLSSLSSRSTAPTPSSFWASIVQRVQRLLGVLAFLHLEWIPGNYKGSFRVYHEAY